MLGQLRHRGPDQFGIYLDEKVGLGNARLSIVDLEGGQQPICNEDGSLWVVYNGEIFNHPELRAGLEERGHRFVTHTDTEVIVHLFEELGPDAVLKLNGQFAFALWDARRGTLFLARDRLGVRPLFYAESHGRLRFASEIKALFSDPVVSRELDPAGVRQVFDYWAPLAPQTCFRGVRELPPGCCLQLENRQVQVNRYWAFSFEPGQQEDLSSSVDTLEALLTDATRMRLRADVPVGAYLSGGLDSSMIASMVRRLGHAHLDTFSIAFEDPDFDESEHQTAMAKFLGTDHQVVRATHADIGRVFPAMVRHAETPVMRTAPAPMFLLSERVRDSGYKVVLTGEGADEFLGGYDIFKEVVIRQFWARQPESVRRPLLLSRIYPDIGRLAATGPAYLKAFFGMDLTETQLPDYSHRVRWRNNRRTSRLFHTDFIADEACPGANLPVTAPDGFGQWGVLERAQYLEASIFLSGYLLAAQGDRVAMAHSVEGRYPFLDWRVVEFCTRLPSRLKLRGLREKWLLRQVARDYLPEQITQRKKRPYRAPIHRCFADDTGCDYVRELLSPEVVERAGVFKSSAVGRLAGKLHAGAAMGETDDMALVGVISTQLLHAQLVSGYRAQAPVGEGDDVKVVDRRNAHAT